MTTCAMPASTSSSCSNRSRKIPKKQCPECGKKKLRRLIGPGAAIVFKGSGFYTTDYRSESYKKAAAADKPASPSATTEKSAEGKSAGGSAKKEKGGKS